VRDRSGRTPPLDVFIFLPGINSPISQAKYMDTFVFREAFGGPVGHGTVSL